MVEERKRKKVKIHCQIIIAIIHLKTYINSSRKIYLSTVSLIFGAYKLSVDSIDTLYNKKRGYQDNSGNTSGVMRRGK